MRTDRRRRRWVFAVAFVAAAVVSACTEQAGNVSAVWSSTTTVVESVGVSTTVPEVATSATSTSTTSTSVVEDSTSTSGSVEPVSQEAVVELTPVATAEARAVWEPIMTLGYGPGRSELGFEKFGPDYAAVDHDGVWWVADSAKGRIAKFDTDGTFIADIPVDFYVRLPVVMDDGSVWVFGSDKLLVVRGGQVSTYSLDGSVVPLLDDGAVVFGHGYPYPMVSISRGSAYIGKTEWLRSRAGTRFRLRPYAETPPPMMELEWDGRPATALRLSLVGPQGAAVIFSGFDADTTHSDVVYLLVHGYLKEGDELESVARLVACTSAGVVATVPVPVEVWDDAANAPAQLVVDPATDTLHLVAVDATGLHIWRLANPEAPK